MKAFHVSEENEPKLFFLVSFETFILVERSVMDPLTAEGDILFPVCEEVQP